MIWEWLLGPELVEPCALPICSQPKREPFFVQRGPSVEWFNAYYAQMYPVGKVLE